MKQLILSYKRKGNEMSFAESLREIIQCALLSKSNNGPAAACLL